MCSRDGSFGEQISLRRSQLGHSIGLAIELRGTILAARAFEIDDRTEAFRDLDRAVTLDLRVVGREIRRPDDGAPISQPDWKAGDGLIARQRQQVDGCVQSL